MLQVSAKLPLQAVITIHQVTALVIAVLLGTKNGSDGRGDEVGSPSWASTVTAQTQQVSLACECQIECPSWSVITRAGPNSVLMNVRGTIHCHCLLVSTATLSPWRASLK